MKYLLIASIVLLASCSKDAILQQAPPQAPPLVIDTPPSVTTPVEPSKEVVARCYVMSFTELFDKTFNTDTTVNKLNMRTINFLGSETIWDESFTYIGNTAIVAGNRYVYFDSTVNEVIPDNIEVVFNFAGYAERVYQLDEGNKRLMLTLDYDISDSSLIKLVRVTTAREQEFIISNDTAGNITSIKCTTCQDTVSPPEATYVYNQAQTGKAYFYKPSIDQGGMSVISDLYTLLEAMQWIPESRHERTYMSVTSGAFESAITKLSDYQYDSDGKLITYTATNVTKFDQTISSTSESLNWFCKN